MKHCIIVKFNEQGAGWEGWLGDVAAIFDRTRAIPGVHGVRLIHGTNLGGNRYDLMIEMDMDAQSLPVYDACEAHHDWKDKYGKFIDKKCIFDYEG